MFLRRSNSNMWCSSRRQKVTAICVFLILIIYIEFFSYILNTRFWPEFPITPVKRPSILESDEIGKPFDLRGVDPLRILLVADPQLIGENEHRFFGPIANWDSDRYIRQNYNLAKNHVKPNIVVFLGDLVNNGLVAYDAEYRRYYKRFINIFQVPHKSDPSPIEYVYLPGDNDVGGENEPMDSVRLKWFNITFGDYHKPFRIQDHGWDLQILKMWTLDFKRTHLPTQNGSNAAPKIQLMASHMPLLKFTSASVEKLVMDVNPSVILSGHDHHSTLYTYDKVSRSGINYFQNFLQLKSNESRSSKMRLNIGNLLYEIGVPTCSYRMGSKEMGFGVLEIYKNGTIDYSVLWLESRFSYLYAYVFVYILIKIILARWILWKLWRYISSSAYNYIKLKPRVSTRTC